MLTLTPRAQTALAELLKKTELLEPVVVVVKSAQSAKGPRNWSLAIADRQSLPNAAIQELGGAPVYIDDPSVELEQLTIDYVGGRFVFL